MKGGAPFGFWAAGALSAWFCVAMVVMVCVADPAYDDDAWLTLGRGAAGLLAVLSAVVTEALWRARPWVWRASLALALAYAVIVFVSTTADPASNVGEAFALLMASAVVVVPLLAYVRSRAKVMWPKQPPRSAAPIAVPRPAPRPGGQP
jgi:peptidoglycan/LPS O-acetylase OafA/YrhL